MEKSGEYHLHHGTTLSTMTDVQTDTLKPLILCTQGYLVAFLLHLPKSQFNLNLIMRK